MFCSLRERVLIGQENVIFLSLSWTSSCSSSSDFTFNLCLPPTVFFLFLSPSPILLFQPVHHQYSRFVCLSIDCTIRFDVISHNLCPFFPFLFILSDLLIYLTLLKFTWHPFLNRNLPFIYSNVTASCRVATYSFVSEDVIVSSH